MLIFVALFADFRFVFSLCLPVDGDRIFLEQEMALFSVDTSGGMSHVYYINK